MPTPPHLQYQLHQPGNILWPMMGYYRTHLADGRYTKVNAKRYAAVVLHFGDWLCAEGIRPRDVDENKIDAFVSAHLPSCSCGYPRPLHLITNRAALNILLRLLRAGGFVAPLAPDAVQIEVSRFDARMLEVWGLSQGTRAHRCRIIRRFLRAVFPTGSIDVDIITALDVRNFVLGDPDWSSSTIRVMAGALRCYLRFRELEGDNVAHLHKAIPRPAFWPDADLPEALSDAELGQLYGAFDQLCPSRRRGYAIVRCLADIGLRSSEAIRLTLDDIDWQEGIVRLRAGKGRRCDVLPLSPSTGEAIVDYILHERPATDRREVFVRHTAPLGIPIGRCVVQNTLIAAYRRLGWERTRVHILRHTLATRLVNSGAPMKEVADVLRHRDIGTAAGYARVDIARLTAVAMPWPGEAA